MFVDIAIVLQMIIHRNSRKEKDEIRLDDYYLVTYVT